MYCYSHVLVSKRIKRPVIDIRWSWVVSVFLSWSILVLHESDASAAADFETFDESDVTGESSNQSADELSAMPEIEAEQHDLRLERRNAIGMSLGEVMPLVSLAVEYQRHLTDNRSLFITVGTGSLTSTSQDSGGDAISNKLNTRAIDLGHMWWTSKSFPIASSAFVTAVSGEGVTLGADVPRGRYNVSALGAGGDFKMETLFENGFWLKWSLISLRYLRPLTETHSGIESKNLTSIRSRFLGFKIVGITNITVGYAW